MDREKITGNFASWRVLVCCGLTLLFSYLLCADNRSIGGQREVDPGVGHQVGLELSQVHVESSVKPQRGRDGGHDLPNQPVEVGVGTITEVYYIIPFFFADPCCEASD